jgi:hypothetical protein
LDEISSSAPYSRTPSTYVLFLSDRPSFSSIQNNSKIVILCILSLYFWIANWKTKG